MNKKKILLFMLMVTMSFNINAAQSTSFAETINNENIEVIATYDNEMPQDIKKIYKPKHTGEGVSYFDYIFIKARVSNLREKPDPNSQIVGKYTYDNKLKVLICYHKYIFQQFENQDLVFLLNLKLLL